MSRLAFLAQRLFNTPLMIHPRKAEVLIAALAERLGVGSIMRLEADGAVIVPMAFDDDDEFAQRSSRRRIDDTGYDLLGDIAVIPIQGTLVQKNGTVRPYSGMTGYDGVRQAFALALEDPAVAKIASVIDTPGGEVSGCFDLADAIFAARGRKPIWAILDDMAASAGYVLASAHDRIIVPRTGVTGSNGVIAMHADFSQALDKGGVKVTLIATDVRKTDGYPEIPLAPEALEAIQADIDTLGALLFETVGRNRGMTPEAVRDLHAASFLGAAGLAAGLADAVMAPDAAFRALIAL